MTPILAFGGPYSNLHATQAVLDLAASRGALALCTGDVVAYCGAPSDTVDAIRTLGGPVVAGNCERQLAADAPDCGCGFRAGTACDLMSVGWYGFAASRIGAEARAWMATLPDLIVFSQAGLRFGVLHGGATDVARFVWPTSARAVFEEEWDALEAEVGPVDRVIAGHCGLPFARALSRGTWINAGGIGMPPHDGSSKTRYVVIENAEAQFRALDYDVAAAVADMEAAGLTHGYHVALQSGYWPSEDVLPSSLRRSRANG